MKKNITPAADQTTSLGSCLTIENTSDQPVLSRTAPRSWKSLLLRKAGHPAVLPLGAAHQRAKSKMPLWHIVNLLLCLVLVGPSLTAPFIEAQTAWAAPSHFAHQSTHLISQRPLCAVDQVICDVAGDIANIFVALGYAIYEAGKVALVFFQYDFAGWVACILSAGAVSCPTTSGGTPWSFDCPIVHITSTFSSYSYDSSTGLVTTSLGSTTYTVTVDGSTGNDNQTIYQLAQNALNNDSVNDWLSGDSFMGNTTQSATSNLASEPGHLIYTYDADTISRPGVQTLSSFSMMIGLTMIGPLFALAGFQLLMASLKPGVEKAMANAIETMGHVLLAAAIVGLSLILVQKLIDFTNQMNDAVVKLHQQIGYPQTSIDGVSAVSYTNTHDTSQSFRGVVMPMALWGCVMDDFIGLMATRVANMIGSMVPLIGGILGLAGRYKEIIDLINDMGEFLLLIASVTLWGQAVARIVLINYYIVLAPVALACWGLPGQMGGQVTRAWFKGFLQLLFMQTVQLLILTTMPALLPDFGLMKFPHGGDLVNPPLQSFLAQLPPIIVAFAATSAPKVMMGMGPMNTVAKAGAIAGKAVGAAGVAIGRMIRK